MPPRELKAVEWVAAQLVAEDAIYDAHMYGVGWVKITLQDGIPKFEHICPTTIYTPSSDR